MGKRQIGEARAQTSNKEKQSPVGFLLRAISANNKKKSVTHIPRPVATWSDKTEEKTPPKDSFLCLKHDDYLANMNDVSLPEN